MFMNSDKEINQKVNSFRREFYHQFPADKIRLLRCLENDLSPPQVAKATPPVGLIFHYFFEHDNEYLISLQTNDDEIK